jgi:hypothetical protein
MTSPTQSAAPAAATGAVPTVSGSDQDVAPRISTATPEILDEIRSLHTRIDELHGLVARRLEDRAGVALHQVRAIPAWRRRTQGELRWPVTVITVAGIVLQMAVPGRLVLIRPSWVLPAAQGALVIALLVANPHRIDRESAIVRSLALMLATLLSLANGWSLGKLAVSIVAGTIHLAAGPLLITGGIIWLTNVVVFALWYWEFDRGGPVARALGTSRYPDFQFVQMTSPPEQVPPQWEPAFADYLYLAFTNASAFSPTDVMPMSRWAKLAMTVQSVISIVTVALVVARAVGLLP